MLRIQELTIDGGLNYITCTAIILRQVPGSSLWEYFGTVTTEDPLQMQGLQNWLNTNDSMPEQEFFKR